jgi:quercetin dioxygenase-like cupin family protein
MKIIHYSKAEPKHFNTDAAKGLTARVVIGQADGAENFCMRFFELSAGGFSPKHAHEWEHEIIIHSGKGEILCQAEWVPVTRGTVIFIPGQEEHQIKNTGEQPLVFACIIPSGPPEL